MRALPTRRLASSALCATLLLGITGPAAVAADHHASHDRTRTTAPVPESDALLPRARQLADAEGVVAPVADLLQAALKADHGRLSPDEAARLDKAVKEAIARVAAPSPSPAPAKPGQQAQPPVGDALAALQKAVADLLLAATAGNTGQVLPAATAVLTKLINVVVAAMSGGATLPGGPSLPPVPTLTSSPSLPPMQSRPPTSPVPTPTVSHVPMPTVTHMPSPSKS
jgi:hypothetical protein